MQIKSIKKVLQSATKAQTRIGTMFDNMEYERKKENYERVLAIREAVKGYRSFNLNIVGHKGVGKTTGVIEACTEIGVPVIVIYPAQWVDNSDAIGMPKVREINGVEITKNIAREFFPRHKEVNGKKVRHLDDGTYMIDFESVKEYIANYEEMMVYYKGEINNAKSLVILWDEFNRIVVNDVKQLMFGLMANHKLDSYEFPRQTVFVTACNPHGSGYDVSNMFEEDAMVNRFIHIKAENDGTGLDEYMEKNNFHWSVKALVRQHPEIVETEEISDEEFVYIKPSSRSTEDLNTIMKFSTFEQDLDPDEFFETISGVLGSEYAADYALILKKGIEEIPNKKDIVTNYDAFRPFIQKVISEGDRQDIINKLKKALEELIKDDNSIEEYNLLPTEKGENGEYVIPEGLENIHKVFQDLPPEYGVEIITEAVRAKKKMHSVLSRHTKLYKMLEPYFLEVNTN
ncbi:hypothetical protein U8V72_10660 [Priestia filamentosa]|uniref:hypothetical protein n=1 Tax=Priestia filamentosa TaxID=1402861 RepID=UPI003979D2C7